MLFAKNNMLGFTLKFKITKNPLDKTYERMVFKTLNTRQQRMIASDRWKNNKVNPACVQSQDIASRTFLGRDTGRREMRHSPIESLS